MKILYTRSNPISPDPRVEKEVKALIGNGHQVEILCWNREKEKNNRSNIRIKNQIVPINYINIRSSFGSGIKNLFPLIKFNLYLLKELFLKRKNIDAIHAADFDTIIPATIIKFFFRKKVVYDIFDFYADAFKLPPILSKIVRYLDLKIIGYCDHVILPIEYRIDQIKGAKPQKITFIHNTPDIANFTPKLEKNRDYSLYATYVGILQDDRLLLETINIFKKNKDWCLIIAGFGKYHEQIEQASNEFSNIIYKGKVDYDTALELNSQADVLFATYNPLVKNHKFSAPNKLYEAMALSKPIIVCQGTGVDQIVRNEGIGLICEYNEESLESAFREISKNIKHFTQEIGDKSNKIYKEKFSWEQMEVRLVEIYKNI